MERGTLKGSEGCVIPSQEAAVGKFMNLRGRCGDGGSEGKKRKQQLACSRSYRRFTLTPSSRPVCSSPRCCRLITTQYGSVFLGARAAVPRNTRSAISPRAGATEMALPQGGNHVCPRARPCDQAALRGGCTCSDACLPPRLVLLFSLPRRFPRRAPSQSITCARAISASTSLQGRGRSRSSQPPRQGQTGPLHCSQATVQGPLANACHK